MKITKTVLDNAEARAKPYFIWCAELPGFGARVFPSGKKIFYADYYNHDGRRKRMSLGHFGKLTADEARKLARITLGSVLQKDDPLLERQTRRSSLTVGDLCDQYLKATEKGLILGKSGKKKKQSTLDTDKGRVERHIKPLLGSKLVIDLKRADVSKFIRDVTAGKTAMVAKSEKLRGKVVVKGGAGTASRTSGLLSGILTYAVTEGVIEANPAHGVLRPTDKKKERRLTVEEYKAIGKALDAMQSEPWQVLIGIRLLILTGCRRGEIIKLKWSEVDLAGSMFKLGDSKTGASIRPIGKPVVELLAGIKTNRPVGYVLPGVRNEKSFYGGMASALKRLNKAAGLTGVTAHTFRHSLASVAADLNYSDSTIGAILGHSGSGITSRYTHRLDSVLITAADKIAQDVLRQMQSAG